MKGKKMLWSFFSFIRRYWLKRIVDRFWKKSSEHCPETRVEIANQHRKTQNKDVEVKKDKKKRRLFADCGRPYNVNEPKIEFRFEDSREQYVLDLNVHK